MQQQNLIAAKLCYNKALAYLVPDFEGLKADLLTNGFDINLSNKIGYLVNEIAMIFGNQSLVMLKDGNISMAISNAQQSLAYLPTAKVHP